MSDVADNEFWEAQYQAGRFPWDIGVPAPALERYLAEHPGDGARAVVLGCGRGHDAIALARSGYQVTAVDFAPTAIEEARALAAHAGVPVSFVRRDVFALLPEYRERFGLLFEHTCFCAIPPARRGDYVTLAHGLLAPGGRFVGVFFTHGEPGGPPFDTSAAEVRALFEPAFSIDALAVTADSVPDRRGEEHLAVFTRRERS